MFAALFLSFAMASTTTATATTSVPPAESTATVFGEPITLTAKTSLTNALRDAATKKDQDVLIDGRIKQVCEKKGCWMVLSEGDAEVRVTFKGYAFFVPKNSAGKSALVQGRVVEKEESVDEQRHYLEDGGASPQEIAKVREPKKVKSFVASGVRFLP